MPEASLSKLQQTEKSRSVVSSCQTQNLKNLIYIKINLPLQDPDKILISDKNRILVFFIALDEAIFFSQKIQIQSTLVISKSKELSEILRDIRTSTYQIYRIEEQINRITTFHKSICNLTYEIRGILKILWKSGEIAP